MREELRSIWQSKTTQARFRLVVIYLVFPISFAIEYSEYWPARTMLVWFETILWSIGTETPFSPRLPLLLSLMHLFLVSIPAVFFFYRLDDHDVDFLAKSVAITVGMTFFSVSILSPRFLFPWIPYIDPVYSQGYSLDIASSLVLTILVVSPAFCR